MKLVGTECIFGVMVKNTKALGSIIKCMGKAIFGGLMEKNILGTFLKIKGTELEGLNGEMAGSTKENGSRESNMEVVSTETEGEKRKKEPGWTEGELAGFNEVLLFYL